MNGVTERHNHTLMEMANSMLSHTTLPLSLWGEALKPAVYILNRVQLRQLTKLLMSCGLNANLVCNISEYEVVQLRLSLIGQMKRN
jgi:hypothetical protein